MACSKGSVLIVCILLAIGVSFVVFVDLEDCANGGGCFPSPMRYSESKGNIEALKGYRFPDCLIIGVRKGGTRAVSHFLNKNPNIVTTDTELNFFGDDNLYAKGLQWYSLQMPMTTPGQVLIEKTADYLTATDAPERIYKFNKDIKIILIVRDPIARTISDYYFIRRFAKRVNAEGQFKETKNSLEALLVNNKTGTINYDFGGLYRSKYGRFFPNWLKYFKLSQIHIVDGDKLQRENPAKELNKIEKFLGVESKITEDEFYYLKDKKFWCSHVTGCLGSEKGHINPTIRPSVENKIRKFLKPFNEDFYSQTGINFGWKNEV